MIHVYVICEGQTEVQFVEKILAPHLGTLSIFVYGRLLGRPGHKGGNVRFERLARDIRDIMKSHAGAYCTTFFDFYGLTEDFPGKAAAKQQAASTTKANLINQHLQEKLQDTLGDDLMHRFIPYVQMYEFEALLFSEPQTLAQSISQAQRAIDFAAIRHEFATPEDINDSPQTAPSKRILKIAPKYQKVLDGRKAAEAIGLRQMRSECVLFDAWLTRLEQLDSD